MVANYDIQQGNEQSERKRGQDHEEKEEKSFLLKKHKYKKERVDLKEYF